MKLALIPARGGSKRIPGKNVKLFGGKPMIAWSIAAARESGCFDRIAVSTDDIGIAAVAREYGAEVPFIRPPELSDDYVGTLPVVRHAIDWYSEAGCSPEAVCCLYATAPFVRAADLKRGLECLDLHAADYAFSVTSYGYPIQRALFLNGDGRLEMFQPRLVDARSQDLVEAFHDAGQFYWGRARAWLDGRPVFSSEAIPIILPRHRVQDIDTPEDWARAEWLFREMAAAD